MIGVVGVVLCLSPGQKRRGSWFPWMIYRLGFWRNQGLHLLTERYRTVLAEALERGDVSAGLEFVSSTERELYFTGVPEQVEFREAFEAKLQTKGILLRA